MTTEMQEIAITEDKPLLTGQADAVKVRDDDVTQTEACTQTYGTHCAHEKKNTFTVVCVCVNNTHDLKTQMNDRPCDYCLRPRRQTGPVRV